MDRIALAAALNITVEELDEYAAAGAEFIVQTN